jgi:predicted RNA-binding Zn ribbon-like protein
MNTEAFDFSTIDLLHEHLCLDFINSTSNHGNPSEDHLNSYADLVSWAQDVKLLDENEALHLWQAASQQPSQAGSLHQKALVLREALYHILLAASRDQTPEAADLDTFNTALAEAMSHMRLSTSADGFGWIWEGDKDNLEYLIWQIVWSASELLRSSDLQKVSKCEGCDWLFLDTSRGRRRSWCDMSTCGNRAKARRYYRRAKKEE